MIRVNSAIVAGLLLPFALYADEGAYTALENSDYKTVKQYVRKIEKGDSSLAQKKAELNELAGTAKEIVEHAEADVSLTSNMFDLAKFALGVPASLICAGTAAAYGYLVYSTIKEGNFRHRQERFESELKNAVVMTIGSIGAAYLARQGWRCSAQLSKIKNAQRCEEHLQKRLSQLEATK
jgi:hypothetical protein